ncbi:MAG: phosphatidylglycerophosphatase A [Patescibacteria group bacterium]
MIDLIAFYLSSILGLCKKTKFPGTIASFAALFFSFLAYYFFNKTVYIFLFFIFLAFGFWAIQKIHKKNGIGDYQWIGIDEFAGMWLANFFLFEFNFNLIQIIIFSLISFIIFRMIDIIKFIPPLYIINQNEKQDATAVLLDDIIAGFYTYFIMLIILGFYNLNFLYSSFLILLPPMIANMTPVLLKTKYWNTPIDEKTFGKNKTWRGFLGAIITGTLSYLILVKLNIIIFPVDSNLIIFIGFLFSFGTIGGDLVKSFLKRKIGIKEGESWMPWDQIDYILGMIILTYFIYQYAFNQIIFLLVLGGTISALVHRFGYIIKMNSAKQ